MSTTYNTPRREHIPSTGGYHDVINQPTSSFQETHGELDDQKPTVNEIHHDLSHNHSATHAVDHHELANDQEPTPEGITEPSMQHNSAIIGNQYYSSEQVANLDDSPDVSSNNMPASIAIACKEKQTNVSSGHEISFRGTPTSTHESVPDAESAAFHQEELTRDGSSDVLGQLISTVEHIEETSKPY